MELCRKYNKKKDNRIIKHKNINRFTEYQICDHPWIPKRFFFHQNTLFNILFLNVNQFTMYKPSTTSTKTLNAIEIEIK